MLGQLSSNGFELQSHVDEQLLELLILFTARGQFFEQLPAQHRYLIIDKRRIGRHGRSGLGISCQRALHDGLRHWRRRSGLDELCCGLYGCIGQQQISARLETRRITTGERIRVQRQNVAHQLRL